MAPMIHDGILRGCRNCGEVYADGYRREACYWCTPEGFKDPVIMKTAREGDLEFRMKMAHVRATFAHKQSARRSKRPL